MSGLVGSNCAVTVLMLPADPSLFCTVSYGEGAMPSADVTDVSVNCVNLGEIIFSDGFE